MGKTTGFLEHSRELAPRRPVTQRVNDWFEIYLDLPEEKLRAQGARCMDCGVPFCQTGCPVNNLIPDWNDLIYRGRWKEAVRQLHATNNFPEFTGRICPAPCEASCVLGINQPPVTIKQNEKNIVERGFREGWIRPEPPKHRTGKKVAIVGSGPAGLAAAQQLSRAGHSVTVYEKADRIGGLLRYGIPEFKMEKHVIDRRLHQMEAEGVRLVTNTEVGKNVVTEELRRHFDAIVLAGGAEQPRDLKVPGRELKGVHFAMEFLPQQNRRCLGDTIERETEILATGKRVIIIGGGDTGADCLGTCHRQKPISVHQFEIMPKPPDERSPLTPWPLWPMQLRTEAAHEEGGIRDWSIATTKFTGSEDDHVRQLHAVRVGPPPKFDPIPGTEFTIDADLVLIAMGFLGPVRNGMIEQLGVALDTRGNVATDANYMSSVPGVFAAGDMRRGQSLVVWAISEGRKAAAGVDAYLRTQVADGRAGFPGTTSCTVIMTAATRPGNMAAQAMIGLTDIQAALGRIRDSIRVSPCTPSESFSELTNNSIFLKLDNQQRTGAFKERGALNKLLTLSAEERDRGVIAASAGNHAQGVAYHAGRHHIRARILMPLPTPLTKVSATRGYGADVVLHGTNYDEAYDKAVEQSRQERLTLIHAFDDDAVIAGQGTLGLEILQQHPNVEAIVVPIGGGGLIGGIACAVKETNPRVQVFGVQPARIPSMKAAVAEGKLVTLNPAKTIADGIAVRRAGERTLPLVQKYVDEIVTVEEEEIANAILLLLEREKTLAEGAGAAAMAAVLNRKLPLAGKRVAVLVCGGNIDVTLLARIIERGLVKDGRLVRLRVHLPDYPGALHRLTGILAEHRANIVETAYDRAYHGVNLGDTAIDITMETRGPDHIAELLAALTGAGYTHERIL